MQLEDKFPEWYSLAVPNFTPEQIAARLKTINALDEATKSQSAPQLVRMFYSLPVSDSFMQEFRRHLKDDDPKYVSQDQAELAIVAGGVICSKLARRSEGTNAVALAVVCVEAMGLRKAKRLEDVVFQCRQYLVDESVRVRDDVGKFPEFPEKNLAATIAKLKDKQADLATFAPAVQEQLLRMNAAIKGHLDRVSELSFRMERRRKEESNIAYWLIGGAALDSHKAYSTFSERQASVSAAYDLAKLTEDLPGPIGTRAFLRKMLEPAKYKESSAASIAEVVEDLDSQMIDRFISPKPIDDACATPICFAIAKAKESGGGTDWLSAFKAQTMLDAKKKVGLLDLSELFYTELLLLRALV